MKDSLAFWGPIIARGPASAANDQIFEYLSPLDRPKFEKVLKTLNRALRAKVKGKSRQGAKSLLIGSLFERLLGLLFDGKGAVSVLKNIRSTTSEIDLLLQVEPMGQFVPMLRDAGTHLIGEAKCRADAPSSALTDKFAAFLQNHNAKLGVLFVNCSSRSVPLQCRMSISLQWIRGTQVVPFGRKQLEEVRKGAPFLRVLRDQHMQAMNHMTKLAI